MMYVARGLRHVEGQQNRVVSAIVHMADRVVLLEEEVALHRQQLNADSANEFTWNQEHKLLLYKLLAICANIDGEVASQEQEILEHKRHDLELREEYLEEAEIFLDNPHSIDDELKRIDSYQKCLNMYRHALGMFYADGKIKPQERSGIEHLAKILHIRPDDKETVKASFARLHGGFSQAHLLSLMSHKKKRTAREPEQKEFDKIDQERASMDAREKSQRQAIREVIEEIEEIGPAWAEQISELISQMIVFPLNERFEKYGSLKDSDLDKLVETLDAETLSKEIDDNINTTFKGLEEVMDDVYAHVALPPQVLKKLESTWQGCVDDDGGWDSALDELQSAGEDLLDSEPSGAWNLMKGGAIGYAGAALFGPIGLLGAVAASYFDGENTQKKFERGAGRWDSAVDSFADATERWQNNTRTHMEKYFSDVLKGIIDLVTTSPTTEEPTAALQCLKEQMDEMDSLYSED